MTQDPRKRIMIRLNKLKKKWIIAILLLGLLVVFLFLPAGKNKGQQNTFVDFRTETEKSLQYSGTIKHPVDSKLAIDYRVDYSKEKLRRITVKKIETPTAAFQNLDLPATFFASKMLDSITDDLFHLEYFEKFTAETGADRRYDHSECAETFSLISAQKDYSFCIGDTNKLGTRKYLRIKNTNSSRLWLLTAEYPVARLSNNIFSYIEHNFSLFNQKPFDRLQVELNSELTKEFPYLTNHTNLRMQLIKDKNNRYFVPDISSIQSQNAEQLFALLAGLTAEFLVQPARQKNNKNWVVRFSRPDDLLRVKSDRYVYITREKPSADWLPFTEITQNQRNHHIVFSENISGGINETLYDRLRMILQNIEKDIKNVVRKSESRPAG